MKNRQILMGMLAIVLVFGLVFVGCEQVNSSTPKEEEQVTKFEGTWKYANLDDTFIKCLFLPINAVVFKVFKQNIDADIQGSGTFTFDDETLSIVFSQALILGENNLTNGKWKYVFEDDNSTLKLSMLEQNGIPLEVEGQQAPFNPFIKQDN
jgi:hypothetical protein